MQQYDKILFYDGVCNLCHNAVRFTDRWVTDENIYFCSLQSEFAKETLKNYPNALQLSTVAFKNRDKVYTESDAFLQLYRYAKFPMNIASIALIFPRYIRNPVYNWIARNRYKWFGKKEMCEIPSPSIRARSIA